MKTLCVCAKVHPSKPTFLVPILTQLRLWDWRTGTPYNRLSLHASTGQISIIHHSLAIVITTPIKQDWMAGAITWQWFKLNEFCKGN